MSFGFQRGAPEHRSCDPGSSMGVAPWNVDLVQYDWHGSVAGMSFDLDVFQGSQQDFQSRS